MALAGAAMGRPLVRGNAMPDRTAIAMACAEFENRLPEELKLPFRELLNNVRSFCRSEYTAHAMVAHNRALLDSVEQAERIASR